MQPVLYFHVGFPLFNLLRCDLFIFDVPTEPGVKVRVNF
jgi:hypothetical protein